MRRYETIVIVDPDLGEENYQAVSDRLTELITQKQGYLVMEDDWGVRNMAYEIKGRKRGHYVRFDYCGDGELVAELERFSRIDDRMLKYMTIVLDKDADVDKIKAQMEESQEDTASGEDTESSEAPPAASDEDTASDAPEDEGDDDATDEITEESTATEDDEEE